MSKIGDKVSDKMLEHVLKNKLGYLYEEVKSDKQGTLTGILVKLDELTKILGKSNDETLKKKIEELTNDNKKMAQDIKTISEKYKESEIMNVVLTKQLEVFQTSLIGAATGAERDKTELAFRGLKSKYEELHDEKASVEETMTVVEKVLDQVTKQNNLLKDKLNLSGGFVDKSINSIDTIIKKNSKENTLTK